MIGSVKQHQRCIDKVWEIRAKLTLKRFNRTANSLGCANLR